MCEGETAALESTYIAGDTTSGCEGETTGALASTYVANDTTSGCEGETAGSLDNSTYIADDMTSGCASECDHEDGPTSILDVLKAPNVAKQNRKRQVLRNRERGGKHRCSSSSTSSGPKRVTPQQRLKEFPGEHLVVLCLSYFVELAEKS